MVQEGFLGEADIQPSFGETLLQRGRASQSRSPLEIRGREKQPHLRQNLGERYYLGTGHREWKKRGVDES